MATSYSSRSRSRKMTDPRALYLHPQGADLSAVKAAVMSLELGYPIRPFWYEPGVPGPVIDLDGTFDYIHDNLRPRTPESLKAAILYCLGEKELTRGPRLVLDMLNDILGGEVIEVPDDGTGQ